MSIPVALLCTAAVTAALGALFESDDSRDAANGTWALALVITLASIWSAVIL